MNISMHRRVLKPCLIVFLGCFVSMAAQAIHLSTYRIYLDPDKRDTSFIVYNRDTLPQDCNLSLRHYNYDDVGQMALHKEDSLPAHSAGDWIRYSPKKFVLSPTNSQTIRFSMRRKAKAEAAEYRSYLSIDCGVATKEGETDEQLINIKPRLVHNVPIVVRTKLIDVDVKFSDFNLVGNMLHFNLHRVGNRSVYGDLELIDKSSNKRVAGTNGVSVYTETVKHPFEFSVPGYKIEDLKVRFVEDKTFGGTESVEQDVVLN